jgi:hypothetical protein
MAAAPRTLRLVGRTWTTFADIAIFAGEQIMESALQEA